MLISVPKKRTPSVFLILWISEKIVIFAQSITLIFIIMYNDNNLNVSPKLIKGALWGVVAVVLLIVVMAFIRPWYNVWSQEMEGKAEFAKAEQNRKIKIEEAKANLEAEKLNAQAEIERAKGAAEAIRIENGSITPTYIQYLWVRQQSDLSDKTVIYVPTETNLPILESTRALINNQE